VKGGFFLMKKPLEYLLSVDTNSETAIAARAATQESWPLLKRHGYGRELGGEASRLTPKPLSENQFKICVDNWRSIKLQSFTLTP
jgi:hypothetical protein